MFEWMFTPEAGRFFLLTHWFLSGFSALGQFLARDYRGFGVRQGFRQVEL